MQNGKKSGGSPLVRGATGDWEVVVGLEMHAQVASKAKLFSGASTAFGGEPNSHVSLVDAAMPGMLPVINEACIAQAVRTGLGLNAQINLVSVFDRKNYFYPDLPQGYQISQYKRPIVGAGEVEVDVDGEVVSVGIERLHLEQDAGKLIHDQSPEHTLVDLNRSGVALMEIVSKPDLRSARQAQAFVSKVRTILRYLGTCDGDMEKGNLRADVNVSVRKPGAKLGTRCEIKNVNSIRFIGQAIEAEARRQIDIIEDGGTIEQETRLFDAAKGVTRSMRSKEEAHDYRYFPDPDLLPLELTQAFVDGLKKDLPELPDAKKARFMRDFKLSAYDADVLVVEKESADFFEAVAKGRDGKTAANWVINELFGRLNKEGLDVTASPVSAGQLGAVIDLIASNAISGKIAKDVFEIVWSEGGDPAEIVEKRGLRQVTDTGAIQAAVDAIIAANPDKVTDAKANPKAIGWFVGQVMKSTGGKANPQAVNELLKKKLGSEVVQSPKEPESREVLFRDRRRSRTTALRPRESLFSFYDAMDGTAYDILRSKLNLWLSELPLEHRSELISRMQKAGNRAFGGALCELTIHALLVRLGYALSPHPTVPGSSYHPDYAVVDKRGKTQAYIEVTTVNRRDDEEGELGREAPIYNAIDGAKLPSGCWLSYSLIRAGSKSPPLSPLVKAIEEWAGRSRGKELGVQATRRFTADDWIVELELFASNNATQNTDAIGVAMAGGGWIAPHKDLREAILRKSSRYGALNAPYIVVVGDGKEQVFGEGHAKRVITEAVFGDEIISFIGNISRAGRKHNGVWLGAHGPQNQHLTAVLLLPRTGLWHLREKNWQPILAINPWTSNPIPAGLKRLNYLEVRDDQWVQRDAESFADILELPNPWPPVDN